MKNTSFAEQKDENKECSGCCKSIVKSEICDIFVEALWICCYSFEEGSFHVFPCFHTRFMCLAMCSEKGLYAQKHLEIPPDLTNENLERRWVATRTCLGVLYSIFFQKILFCCN